MKHKNLKQNLRLFIIPAQEPPYKFQWKRRGTGKEVSQKQSEETRIKILEVPHKVSATNQREQQKYEKEVKMIAIPRVRHTTRKQAHYFLVLRVSVVHSLIPLSSLLSSSISSTTSRLYIVFY